MAEQLNDEISLYGASDPLDWEQGEKTISDVVEYLENLPIKYSILTKVPKGKEPVLKTLLKNMLIFLWALLQKTRPALKK